MCIIFSVILVLLSIVSSFISINLNIIIGIISIPVLIFASMYFKEYKNENGKSPNGIGLIDFAAEDIVKLRTTCEKYKHKCPNEIKMIYDVKSGKFDANYRYEVVDYPDTEFFNWMEKEDEN